MSEVTPTPSPMSPSSSKKKKKTTDELLLQRTEELRLLTHEAAELLGENKELRGEIGRLSDALRSAAVVAIIIIIITADVCCL
ncbi:hypothetical protein Pmar_PMAR014952 [Perkinsus marinus ATCC 50983]|uniref:Uncharacterized protein n=1 Tax=Perkinsus marinus (strain ATCC 50983 / TXsc) TaxID=423536 RepID=C5LFB9_PERM5|nr:hypothetical protein Pmar_PMAR014952 [Perkinsus marinus ATCC 50983]EER04551.1 hypothetical protein Pmar_PMAR014952 [Perkinsus marinus ATCC 50983]|eukprot:XP_002772735.1 hypothetical protein Pmar_PMAR014952 [Perkinsus marinus ATCC 50983]